MYMCNDIALPVNSNPGMAFPRRGQPLSKGAAPNFVQDVADFVSAILDYKELIDRYYYTYPIKQKKTPAIF